jgi:hypothetical protein
VIVVPAQTTSEGSERKFLHGSKFELGSGFAPHPLFTRWFEEQIEAGTALLRLKQAEPICGAVQARR